MKKPILIILIALSVGSCKKDKVDLNTTKKVRYEFNPGGSIAYTTYTTIAIGGYGGSAIDKGFVFTDEVKIGDKATLHMSTEKLVGDFEIRINYNGKIIAVDNGVETEGNSKFVYIDRIFTEEDFK